MYLKIFPSNSLPYTEQKMKFSIKDYFTKCDQICSFLRIWSQLLKKSFIENFIFCAVLVVYVALNVADIARNNPYCKIWIISPLFSLVLGWFCML